MPDPLLIFLLITTPLLMWEPGRSFSPGSSWKEGPLQEFSRTNPPLLRETDVGMVAPLRIQYRALHPSSPNLITSLDRTQTYPTLQRGIKGSGGVSSMPIVSVGKGHS